ncbi:MAG: DUF2252 domain-containing protein [Thiomonas sp.]
MVDPVRIIQRFNAGRDPERLAIKYRAMRQDAFTFLRGTCHLFYRQLPEVRLFTKAPTAWLCGDLHLENFGSYKGDNRLAYFDLNDFDEALIAPCTLDLVRLLTSILVAADRLRIDQKEAQKLCRMFLSAYVTALVRGKPLWIERETAQGAVRVLLDGLKDRKRSAFLDTRTVRKGKRRTLIVDGKKALAVTPEQKDKVVARIARFAAKQPNPEFFEVLDVARRIAGTGSLGVDRYVILVHGKGSPDGNYLLDLKQALPSSLLARSRAIQPPWQTEAQRVVSAMQRVQAVSMAFLQPLRWNGTSYVLRGLQPSEDRLSLGTGAQAAAELEGTIQSMGALVAWGQLRSSGHSGAATADELGDYAASKHWQHDILEAATEAARQTRADWARFVQAYDEGAFGTR